MKFVKIRENSWTHSKFPTAAAIPGRGAMITRRAFLKTTGAGCAALSFFPAMSMGDDDFPEDIQKYVREARYYEKLPAKKIRCLLCPRECVIDDRERGYCGVRENRGGIYYTLVYARPCTYHVDPIEKKPLFHFYPGSQAFSIATAGCNVNCKFCQNWEISQVRPEQIRSIYMPPAEVAGLAHQSECVSIAYTYSEPTVFFEFMEDTALAGREKNIKSVVITAGYISEKTDQRLGYDILAMICATGVLYACGVTWLKILTGMTWSKTRMAGMYPFLIGDALKIAAAALIAKALRPILRATRNPK